MKKPTMLKTFTIRYKLDGNLYEQDVKATTMAAALAWVQKVVPDAKDVRPVGGLSEG